MQRSEYTNGRNEEIKAWVEEHTEIKSKIEERIRNVPEANRERAFINTGGNHEPDGAPRWPPRSSVVSRTSPFHSTV